MFFNVVVIIIHHHVIQSQVSHAFPTNFPPHGVLPSAGEQSKRKQQLLLSSFLLTARQNLQ